MLLHNWHKVSYWTHFCYHQAMYTELRITCSLDKSIWRLEALHLRSKIFSFNHMFAWPKTCNHINHDTEMKNHLTQVGLWCWWQVERLVLGVPPVLFQWPQRLVLVFWEFQRLLISYSLNSSFYLQFLPDTCWCKNNLINTRLALII